MSFNFNFSNHLSHDIARSNVRLAQEMLARNNQSEQEDETQSNEVNYRKLTLDALNELRNKPTKSDGELRVLKAQKKVARGKIIATICCALTVVSLVGYAFVQLVLPSVVLPAGTKCAHEGVVNGDFVQYESYCVRDGIRYEHLCHDGYNHTHLVSTESLGLAPKELKNTSTATVYLDAYDDPISAVANKDTQSMSFVLPIVAAIVMPIMICIAFSCLARYGFGKPWYEWSADYRQHLANAIPESTESM